MSDPHGLACRLCLFCSLNLGKNLSIGKHVVDSCYEFAHAPAPCGQME